MPSSEQLVFCPQCSYGFYARQEDENFRCQRRECDFAWAADSATMAQAFSSQNRDAEFSLSVIAGDKPDSFILKSDEPMLIGREHDCAIELSNLLLSRHHAEVVLQDGQVWAKDLGSSAGTLIEREAIGDQGVELKVGQCLIVAGTALKLQVRYLPRTGQNRHVDNQNIIRSSMKLNVLMHGKIVNALRIEEGEALRVGRLQGLEVVLSHPMVSSTHASVSRQDGKLMVLDTGSSTGTFVNGKPVLRKEIVKGDRLQMGPYLFTYDGQALNRRSQFSNLCLVAQNLCKGMGRELFLDDISLSINPGEFVGVLGPSGAGKSTLLNALNGLRPATSGNVLLNEQDLYENFESYRSSIGFVPQDDIIHGELTVCDAITYAARLRLPPDSAEADIRTAVEEVTKVVRLEHRLKTRVAKLSGGERKRVSVAVELVGNPSLLFLDEPTAALDPGTAGALMRTFREMANQGRTLICTTHIMENLDMFNKVVVLVRGKLAFFGAPRDAIRYFAVRSFVDLYDRLESKTPEVWQEAFRQHCESAASAEPNARAAGMRHNPKPKSGPWSELTTLTSRYWKVYFADWRSAASIVVQALIIGLLINCVCTDFSLAAFLTSISCLWFGCNQSAREVVKERAIFARERMVGQSVTCYFFSKVIVLLAGVMMQSALMILLLYGMTGHEGNTVATTAVLCISGMFGTLLGLAISTLVRTEMAAVVLVPLALIPQIILAGALVPIPFMSSTARALSYACPTRWTNAAMDSAILTGEQITPEKYEKLLKKNRASIQNAFPAYDTREAADRERFVKDKFERYISLTSEGDLSLLIIALFCGIAVGVAMLSLLTQRAQ